MTVAKPVSEPGSRFFRFPVRAALSALALAGLLGMGWLTAQVARAYPVSSDDATGLLEAASVLRGNPLLSGWIVSNISFFTTDLPFYVAGVALRGLDPALLRDVPSAIYAISVGVAVILAASGNRNASLAAAATLVLLGLPAGGLAEFVTKGYTRVGTTIGFFIALLALQGPAGRAVSVVRLAAYTLVAALTLFSDTFLLVMAVVPVLVICLMQALRHETYEDIGLGRIAACTGLAVLLAQAGAWLIRSLGGFAAQPLPLSEYLSGGDPVRLITTNAWALVEYLPSLYRCGLPERGTYLTWLVWLGCLIGPILLVAAWWWARPLKGPRCRADFVNDVLWMSLMTIVAAFLVSGNEKDRGTLRYMVPFVVAGAVLSGRVLGAWARTGKLAYGLLSFLAAAYGVTVAWDLAQRPANDEAARLARWLDEHDLRHGYGPYWDASIVTASSGGRVAVRPVRGREVGPRRLVIEPFRWMSDEAWYREGPANFVVYRPDPGPKWHFFINDSVCSSCFGRPRARYEVGPYVVLVWDRDLRNLLTTGLPWTP